MELYLGNIKWPTKSILAEVLTDGKQIRLTIFVMDLQESKINDE